MYFLQPLTRTYDVLMFQGPTSRKTFVAVCKRCRRHVSVGLNEFPFQIGRSRVLSLRREAPLTRQSQMNAPEVPAGKAIEESINVDREIFNTVFRKAPKKVWRSS